MCFGAVGDAIGDAFSSVDKAANAINPFKGITDWGTDNTLGKIPGIGKPLGQFADWGDSHPAEVGTAIGAGWAAAAEFGAAGAGAAADGGLGGGVAPEAAAAGEGAGGASLPADVSVGTTGAGGATATAAATSSTPGWVGAAGTAAKYVAPAVVSSLLAPKPPKTQAPTAMPDPLAIQQAQQQKIISQLAQRGRASTILTNPGNSAGSLGG